MVLQALVGEPFEPLRTASLQFLTLKVAFLIAITLERRISELGAISTRANLYMFHDDSPSTRLCVSSEGE